MVTPGKILSTRMKALQRQAQNIKNFITQPTGVFETLDNIIKTTRYANRETMHELRAKRVAGQGVVLEKTRVVGSNGPIARTVARIMKRVRR